MDHKTLMLMKALNPSNASTYLRTRRQPMLAIYFCLSLVALSLAHPLLAFAQDPQASSTTGLTILHTNDIHGNISPWQGWEGELAGKQLGGMAYLGGAVNQVRREVGAENVILLDAGDTIGDTMIAGKTRGKAIIDAMNAIGYTAMVIGNHEPDFTAQTLKERIADAKFPLLAANIIERDSGELFTLPSIIKEINGIKIGILGLAYPNTPLTTAEKNIQGLDFKDAPEVARKYIPLLRHEGAQIIIVLSHYGLSADKKLAQQVADIDVIVGGHSHNRMQEALQEGNTLIVQAGAHGSDLGRLDLELKNGKIVAHTHRLITLDHATIPKDEKIADIVKQALSPHSKALEEHVGETQTPITRAQSIAGQEARKRDEESPADSLFADLIREKTQVEAVILPGVGYGTSIPPGVIRADDLRNLIPHDGKIVTMTLSGQQIQDIIQQSLQNTYTDDVKKKVGGLVQVSGIHFKYKQVDSEPAQLIEIRVNDDKLNLQQDYKIATNSLLASGGHNYKTFLQGKNRQDTEVQYEMIKALIQQREKIKSPEMGRIEKVGGED